MSRILIFTGEASGDQHGASLATALKQARPDIEIEGLGGLRMQAAGVRLISGIEKLDIIGVPTLPELSRALRVFRQLSQYIKTQPCDAVVLIDNPGLNLRLARVAKQAGRRVIYYIAPQVWAWNERRIITMRKYVDCLLVILPFEQAYFQKGGVEARFIGHPIMDEVSPTYDVPALRAAFGVAGAAAVIGIFPGSRKSEVSRLAPLMLEAAQRLGREGAERGIQRAFLVAHAPSIPRQMVDSLIAASGARVVLVTGRAYDVIAASDALMAASGTATLQMALVGRPMTIAYRTSALSYAIFRHLVRVRWIGLANLIAERQIATELIQDDATAERLFQETLRLLNDPDCRKEADAVGRELRAKLGPPGASGRAAAEILAMLPS
jgi:lipid-A-disaccharide synthase